MIKRRLGAFLIIIGVLVAAAGVAWAGYNLWDDQRAGAEAEGVLEAIARNYETIMVTPGPVREEASMPAPEPTPDPDREMPVLEVNGSRYVGTVSIPAIEVELPVQDSWSLPLLKLSPCRYKGTVYRSDLIICAHNYATHFGRLKNLLPGDTVIFTDVEGNAYRYTVTLLEDLAGTAVEEMESGDWDLTLFTCTLGGRTRVTVRCRLVENIE